jgi:DnaJ-class molecular chaperone
MGTKIVSEGEGEITLECSFCRGRGIDPFRLLSPLSTCQVCWGEGRVKVHKPAIECAYCGGTGIHLHRRLTCTVCGGKGMADIREPAETCPECRGRGIVAGEYLPCLRCRGKGVIRRE